MKNKLLLALCLVSGYAHSMEIDESMEIDIEPDEKCNYFDIYFRHNSRGIDKNFQDYSFMQLPRQMVRREMHHPSITISYSWPIGIVHIGCAPAHFVKILQNPWIEMQNSSVVKDIQTCNSSELLDDLEYRYKNAREEFITKAFELCPNGYEEGLSQELLLLGLHPLADLTFED